MTDFTLSEKEIEDMTEVFLVALTLFREARSESYSGMQRVHDVIANRAADSKKRWPVTRMGVVLQPHQFSCFNPDDSQAVLMPKLKDVADWLSWISAMRIAKRGVVVHPSINHYHTRAVKPKWAAGKKPAATVGSHLFYAL